MLNVIYLSLFSYSLHVRLMLWLLLVVCLATLSHWPHKTHAHDSMTWNLYFVCPLFTDSLQSNIKFEFRYQNPVYNQIFHEMINLCYFKMINILSFELTYKEIFQNVLLLFHEMINLYIYKSSSQNHVLLSLDSYVDHDSFLVVIKYNDIHL